MSRSFGRALIVAIYPKKSVILEIEEEDGSIVRKTVKLSSDEELVKMILSHEKIRVMD
ncbi:hypothetical protein [Photobacterium damselae]|nr:hypothetical protein [Photobacterium damselae]